MKKLLIIIALSVMSFGTCNSSALDKAITQYNSGGRASLDLVIFESQKLYSCQSKLRFASAAKASMTQLKYSKSIETRVKSIELHLKTLMNNKLNASSCSSSKASELQPSAFGSGY